LSKTRAFARHPTGATSVPRRDAARVPLDVPGDVIQPFPTFSEIYVDALKALRVETAPALETA
jgi:hypothetical protein